MNSARAISVSGSQKVECSKSRIVPPATTRLTPFAPWRANGIQALVGPAGQLMVMGSMGPCLKLPLPGARHRRRGTILTRASIPVLCPQFKGRNLRRRPLAMAWADGKRKGRDWTPRYGSSPLLRWSPSSVSDWHGRMRRTFLRSSLQQQQPSLGSRRFDDLCDAFLLRACSQARCALWAWRNVHSSGGWISGMPPGVPRWTTP